LIQPEWPISFVLGDGTGYRSAAEHHGRLVRRATRARDLTDPAVQPSRLKSGLGELPVRPELSRVKPSAWPDAAERALRSGGTSETAIYAMVADALRYAGVTTGRLHDIGCGSANLYPFVRDWVSSYVGVDLVRYDSFPAGAEWIEANLDLLPLPLPAECTDVVAAVETIEHLENPHALCANLCAWQSRAARWS